MLTPPSQPRHCQTAAPPDPLHGTPALPWPGWHQGGVREWSSCCPGNQAPHHEGRRWPGQRESCGWASGCSFGSSGKRAPEAYPTQLLWGYLPPCPLPLQSQSVSNLFPPVSPGFPITLLSQTDSAQLEDGPVRHSVTTSLSLKVELRCLRG